MFKVPEKKSIQEIEAEILNYWTKNKIFEKSVESRSDDDLYVFYDGPPFISGLPHYGHLLGSIAKDLIPRYWTMKGKKVERVWGWDAHGLTVENKVQKKLKISNRRDIEKFGLEKFTKECYKYTSETSAEWKWYVDRIARWVDFENAYKTIDINYMESVMWAFKQLYEKDLIYVGVYTSLFCPTCGTPVSDFEIAMDNSYKEFEDPSITVKFFVTSKGKWKDKVVLAWTTTPWTIPSNRGLVVDEKAKYLLIEYENHNFVVAKELAEKVFEDKKYVILEEFLGKELVGLKYKAPYDFYKPNENDFKIYSYEGMVNMDDGTGIVHSAPGFGMIDTDMGKHYGLTVMLTIDDEGKFEPGNNGENPFEGVFYRKANDLIKEDLKKRGLLFSDSNIMHRVPFHDRCDTLLIQRAQNSWFVNIQKIKKDMLKNNEDINWVPAYLKNGRFKEVLETAPDWCISRNRFWATPMPVWESEDGERIVAGSIKEIEDLSDQKVKDLHRPYIDNIEFKKEGKTYKRIPEVLDSWFEAGSMPYAQWHYPFENKEKFDKNFPGDYVVEYIAQVRAWFNQMHRLSTAIFNKAPFLNVISTGVMAGSDGRKMSKTYSNYADPKEVLENIGGDALRLYLMSSPLMMGENANFDNDELRTKLRNVLNPLLNSASYFLIFAKQYDWKPGTHDLSIVPKSENIMDKWILGRLHETIKTFTENIEEYLVPSAVKCLESFVDDLSRWYIRRSRDRISRGDKDALETLYYVLSVFTRASAPVIPFSTEYIYRLVVLPVEKKANESVHLETYPEFSEEMISETRDILLNMKQDREIVAEALALRSKHNMPIKQTLSVLITQKEVNYKEIVADEINVIEIFSGKSKKEMEKFAEDPNFIANETSELLINIQETEEVLLDRAKREIIRSVQELRKEKGLVVSDRISAEFLKTEINAKVVHKFGNEIKEKINADRLDPADSFSIKKI